MTGSSLAKLIRSFPVCRITVDEVLDESSIRVLVAPLADGVRDVSVDDVEDWQEEVPGVVTPEDCLSVMGARGKELVSAALRAVGGAKASRRVARQEFFGGLREGQVFLVGRFTVAKRGGEPQTITVVGGGPRQMLRIDRLEGVKNSGKKLYAEALVGKEVRDG